MTEQWQEAITKGELARVKEMMLDRPSLLKDERNALHWAISSANQTTEGTTIVETIIDGLLAAGEDVDPEDDAGWTPLFIATSLGRGPLVELLLEAGADVRHVNENKQTVWHYAASKNHLDVLHLLRDVIKKKEPSAVLSSLANQPDKYGATPLHRAAAQGSLPIVRFFIADLKIKSDKADAAGNTPAHLAAEGGHVDILYFLLDEVAQQMDTLSEAERKEALTTLYTRQLNKDGESIMDCLGGRSVTKEEKKKLQSALQAHLQALFE